MNAHACPRPHTRTPALLLFVSALLLTALPAAAQRRPARPRPAQPAAQPAGQPNATPTPTPAGPTAAQARNTVALRWRGTPGVSRYRLQVARDRQFGDIVYDRAVVGLETQVELPAGNAFFWRVAPAARETGSFSTPEAVPLVVTTTNDGARLMLHTPVGIGWQAVTGAVVRPQPAPLRSANQLDVVAVSADGTTYALDGVSGAALWTARYRPDARRGEPTGGTNIAFAPLVVRLTEGGKANVVVAYEGGVRALDGESGRELWRVPLPGPATGGALADLDADNLATELAVVCSAPPTLIIIDGKTGHVNTQQKLDAAPLGVPIPFTHEQTRGIALSLAGGLLEIRKPDGPRLRGVKFDVPFTTPPLIISGPNGTLVAVGTEHGLLFLNGADLTPIGKLTTEGDMPRGRLAGVDLEQDGLIEMVAIMQSGRVVVISAAGRLTWSEPGAPDAYTPLFADLNGDGVLDVIVAAGNAFVRALSGRDGSLIWEADETRVGAAAAPTDPPTLRSLAIIFSDPTHPLLVSGDPAHASVRAIGLPLIGPRTAVQAEPR